MMVRSSVQVCKIDRNGEAGGVCKTDMNGEA